MSQRIEVVLDDQGRLVLPSSLRRELGLTTGATLVVERQTEDAAYLRVQKEEEPHVVDKRGVLVVRDLPSGDLAEDLADVVRRERDRRAADLLRRAGV